MKTAVAQVYSVLEPAFKTVKFYSNEVPETALTQPVLPIGRIVELNGHYSDFKSNEPGSISLNVQVDLWVKTLKDVDSYYFLLDEVLRKAGWACTYTEQTSDPDLKGAKRIIKRYRANLSLA